MKKNIGYVISALLTLCLGVFSYAAVQAVATLIWTNGVNLPTARDNAAAVTMTDGTIILLGGASSTPLAVSQLTPNATNWTAAVSLKNPIYAPGAVLTSTGTIMVFGGRESNNKATRSSFGYSPTGNNSSSMPSMSAPRFQHAYTNAFGTIFAIGGRDDTGQALASVEVFGGNKWNAAPALPEGRYGFNAVPLSINGSFQVLTFGGTTATAASTKTVNRYTFATGGTGGTWTTAAPMLVATNNSAVVVGANNLIYVIGGSSFGAPTNIVQIYNTLTDTWEFGTPLPAAVSAPNAAIDAAGNIIVMGGISSSNTNVATVVKTPQADVEPVLTSNFPNTIANAGTLYTSAISASGKPFPTYSVITGPTGLNVDANTGGVTWTPDASQTGVQNVTLRASNPLGSVDQSYSITVNPPAPTGLAVTGVTANTADLSWSPVVAGANAVTYRVYNIVCSGRGGCGFRLMLDNLTSTNATVTGLGAGGTYRFVVTAVAAGLESPAFGLSSVTATTLRPAAPTNPIVTNITRSSISLSWTAASDTPLPIVGYRIFSTGVAVLDVTDTAGTVSGLTPNTMYFLSVAALDAAGNQSVPVPLPNITTNSIPTPFHTPVYPAPQTEQVVAVIGDRLMVVSASAHSSIGADYIVSSTNNLPAPTFSVAAGQPGLAVDPITGKVTLSPVDGPTGTFTATIRATNIEGFGDFTFSYTVYPAGTDLLSPTTLTAFQGVVSNITRTSATITWQPATDNVGVAGYNIYTQTPPGTGCTRSGCPGPIVLAGTSVGTGTSFNLTNLTRGTTYWVWIQAYDAAGNISTMTTQASLVTLP